MAEPDVHLHREAPTSSHHAERRARRRTPVSRVICWSPAPGAILNASRTGLCIESFRPIQPGRGVFLTLKLTGRTGRIIGHARWCRRITTKECEPVLFRIGVELLSPIEESWFTALMRPSRTDRFRRR